MNKSPKDSLVASPGIATKMTSLNDQNSKVSPVRDEQELKAVLERCYSSPKREGSTQRQSPSQESVLSVTRQVLLDSPPQMEIIEENQELPSRQRSWLSQQQQNSPRTQHLNLLEAQRCMPKNKPLGAQFSYIIDFLTDKRREYPEYTRAEHTQMLVNEYFAASDPLQKPYIAKYQSQLAQFDKQMNDWRQRYGLTADQLREQLHRVQQQLKNQRNSGESFQPELLMNRRARDKKLDLPGEQEINNDTANYQQEKNTKKLKNIFQKGL